MAVYVTANRCRDLASKEYGKLLPHTFKIHKQRPRIEWFDGEVCVNFPTWALAQRAINQARRSNFTPWDEAVAGYFPGLQSLMGEHRKLSESKHKECVSQIQVAH